MQREKENGKSLEMIINQMKKKKRRKRKKKTKKRRAKKEIMRVKMKNSKPVLVQY